MLRFFSGLILFFLSYSSGIGQCVYETQKVIQDLETTVVKIVVEGTESNDLATNNCLEAVKIHFKHQFVADLSMELVSPAGQSVNLVGPNGIGNAGTEFVLGWNVTFVENAATAAPDPGYEEIWNNDQVWFNSFLYTGTYYPHQGQLEDFNTGSVNGEWILNITDSELFGDGEISYMELFFCDTDGQECLTCTTISHSLDEVDASICEGDEELNFVFNPTLSETYDSMQYNYGYAIFEDGIYDSFSTSSDFTSYDPGTYTICGLHYFLDDEALLSAFTSNAQIAELDIALTTDGICAKSSDNCKNVTILSRPEEGYLLKTICAGDSIEIEGTFYKDPGLYQVVTPRMPCDSFTMLEIINLNVDFNFSMEFDSLSCENSMMTIDASGTNLPVGTEYLWTTADGNILEGDSTVTVEIDKPGGYNLEIQFGDCNAETSIDVLSSQDYSYVTLEAGILSCLQDSAFINLESSEPIIDFEWSGPFAFSDIGEDIRVGNAGLYTVTITTSNGCSTTRSIEIEDTRIFPDLTLYTDSIECTSLLAQIGIEKRDTLNSTFEWIFEDVVVGNDTFLIVDAPGIYTLEATAASGCVSSYEVEVNDLVDIIDAQLFGDTISCNSPSVTVYFTSSYSGLNSIWTRPNGNVLVDSSFTTSVGGIYELLLEDEKGCQLDTFIEVKVDDLFPIVDIDVDIFQCGDDSIKIFADSNQEDILYSWSGPGGFMSEEEDPYIFSPGTYYLEGCLPNGCCARDTAFVSADVNVPSLTFMSENLGCDKDTVYIVPSDTSTFNMSWSFNDAPFTPPTDIVTVVDPGTYRVTVTNADNNCFSKYTFNIIDDRVDMLDSLRAEILNCENESVQIIVDSPKPFSSFSWSGPGLLDTSIEPFVNIEGYYFIEYEFTNGCLGSDSIYINEEGEIPNLDIATEILDCNTDSVAIVLTHDASSIAVSWEGPGNFNDAGEEIFVYEAGVYTAFAIAPGSCKDTIEVEVFADDVPPAVSIVKDGDITCSNEIVVLNGTTDATTASYVFNGPGIIDENGLMIEVDQAGLYTLTATGNNGCVSSMGITIEKSTDIPEYTPIIDSITCLVDEVTVGIVSPDQSLSVEWDGPQAVAPNTYSFNTMVDGVYHFTLTNSDDCIASDSFVVLRDTISPNGDFLLSNGLNCAFDEVTFSVANYIPSWDVTWDGPGVVDPSAPSFTTSEIGEYNLRIQSRNGCITEKSYELAFDTTAADIEVIGDDITCSAGKTFLQVVSDKEITSYEWSGPGPNVFLSDEPEPLIFEEGQYFVTVIAVNGCVSMSEITIEDERVFPSIEVEDFYLPCDGAPAFVTYSDISENSDVRWVGPMDYFSPNDTAEVFVEGEYYGIAVNEEGCAFTDTFFVSAEPILPIFGSEGGLLQCFGPIELLATDVDDDRAIEWQLPGGELSSENPILTEVPGIHLLYVTGTNGCVDSMEVEVVDGRIFPDAVAGLNAPFQCKINEVILEGEGSSTGNIYSYSWSTEDGIILDASNELDVLIDGEGTYILEVNNITNGCSSFDTIVAMKEEQSLSGLLIETINPTCAEFDDGIIDIIEVMGGYPPFEFIVDDFEYGSRMEIQYLMDGEHLVTVTDSLGCEFDTIVFLDDNQYPSISLPADTVMNFGDDLLLTLDVNVTMDSIASILWSSNVPCDGCSEVLLSPTNNQTISVLVTDINGCELEADFRITLDRPNKLPFPQIFSPNEDGTNDRFYLPLTKGLEKVDYVKIYDTWGGLLYEGTNLVPGDPSAGWDGRVNGKNVEQAVYIVEALVTLTDGEQVSYVGDLTLIR